MQADDQLKFAYGIFQGGGARGFAHVGALKAAETLGFQFLGVAGTSAGAIVASLAAVGYSPDEIFDPSDPKKHILAPGSPLDLLGRRNWRFFVSAYKELSGIANSRRLLARTRQSIALFKVFRKLNRELGFFDPAQIAKVLNEKLRERLTLSYREAKIEKTFGDSIRFRDINRFKPGCSDLKIIATDLARNRLVVYSSNDTPNVIVAEAVAASAAVPFIFQPATVTWHCDGATGPVYVDGGLASNLPIWVFGDEKVADSRRFLPHVRIPTLGFGFEESGPGEEVTGTFSLATFSARIAAAVLATGQSIHREFVEDLYIIALPCALGMMSFDRPWEEFRDAYVAARDHASKRLDYLFRQRPSAVRSILSGFRDDALAKLREMTSEPDISLRVCTIEPISSRYGRARPLNFRVSETCGFENDADDRLMLDMSNGAAPAAFQRRQPTVWPPQKVPHGQWEERPGGELMTKYERALFRREVQSVFSIPVFGDPTNWRRLSQDRDEPLGVVSIDSDQDLRNSFISRAFMDFMMERTVGLSDVFLRN